jgi:hypothetical protein
MRSIHVGSPVLPTLLAHGIMSQSELQGFEPVVPVPEDTTFCPCVLPERVNACVRLLAGKYRKLITCTVISNEMSVRLEMLKLVTEASSLLSRDGM